jgi:NADPH-dependent 2,4-dienoyl-CoA reductase/sulfur reductase-like enzyme
MPCETPAFYAACCRSLWQVPVLRQDGAIMADSKTFVIVGGGLAGAKAAEALRERGFDGKVVLLAD